jgi:AcrR family transcriptional regulator
MAPPARQTSRRTPRLAPDERRAQLLDCALDALTEEGFGGITVEAIATRAGVTRPVIYDTFGDLEGLMLALLDRAEQTAVGTVLGIVGDDPPEGVDPEEFLFEAVRSFLLAVKADPRTWRLVLMPPRGNSPDLRERIRRTRRMIATRVEELLDWGLPARGGPIGTDNELLSRVTVAVAEDTARLMLAHPRRFPPEQLASYTRNLLMMIPPGRNVDERTPPRPVLAPRVGAGDARGEPARAAAVDGGSKAARKRVPQAERREQLLDTALQILAEEGFGAISMEAIARRVGVNRVVIYRSFPNLPVLLAALMKREDARVRGTLRGLIPREPSGKSPAEILNEALTNLLGAVAQEPETWRVALLRPESAPRALQKIVNRRRASLARRIEPVVRYVLASFKPSPTDNEVEALARMLLTIGEEQGRLALDDPDFPPERLLKGTWEILNLVAMPSATESPTG